ncbi:(Fe-S)-binding protein [Thioalkalivibrio sp.]|uniref:(Fe-S)-binding protein n=1 Tax=Thioalkalivibrio sp. TaxID=2093813 RepID=UPI0039749163
MSNTTTEMALDLEAKRLSVVDPGTRVDAQGDMSDEERVEKAMTNFAKDFGHVAATYMEACIHCGACAHACPFYEASGNPRHTPIWKIEPFKQAYKREAGPLAFFYKAFNLKKNVTVDELKEWQELLYDTCTMCGRCTLICPMSIDIASLVGMARHGMFHAGLVPHELYTVTEKAKREGSPLGATPQVFEDRIEWMGDEHEVDMHVDEDEAEVLVLMSSIEIQKYPESMAATAKILNHMGKSWTFHTEGYEATNFGLLSGNLEWQRDMSMKVISTAEKIGAKLVILPECGHAYQALRWQGANMYGKPLPFKVQHISEFLGDAVDAGALKLKTVNTTVAFHDPCQVSRRGGATSAPRKVLEALGAKLIESKSGGDLNTCCGGGGGVITIHRADTLRYKVMGAKFRQLGETGAEMMVTSCSNCRQNFDDSGEKLNWDKQMNSLLELVADNLVEEAEK